MHRGPLGRRKKELRKCKVAASSIAVSRRDLLHAMGLSRQSMKEVQILHYCTCGDPFETKLRRRATRGLRRDDFGCWVMWRLCCRRRQVRKQPPIHAITGIRLVVSFHDDP